ncbi:MAG: DNA cytosine methyltransferase, partial [Burkholderiales bacterium]
MTERIEPSRRYIKFCDRNSKFFDNRISLGGEKFKFIDLFGGIGGIRLALENVGGRCVFSSEWDQHCQETYRYNFGDVPSGDIQQVALSDIPDATLLAAGFPCQPFSSMGRRQGFMHETQGNLFFRIVEILDHLQSRSSKGPDAILLENVGGLTTIKHGGEKVITSGYSLFPAGINI